MKNISITLLLNAILRGDTDRVSLESMFSTAGYMLNFKKIISGTI